MSSVGGKFRNKKPSDDFITEKTQNKPKNNLGLQEDYTSQNSCVANRVLIGWFAVTQEVKTDNRKALCIHGQI